MSLRKIQILIISLLLLLVTGCSTGHSQDSMSATDHQNRQLYSSEKNADNIVKSRNEESENTTKANETSETNQEKEKEKTESQSEQQENTVKNTTPPNEQKKEETKESTKNTDTNTKKTTTQKKQDTTKEKTTTTPEEKEFVSITINGKETILSKTRVAYQSGDTVLKILQRVTKEKGIPLSVRGNGGTAYVEGINNLFEFDYGPESGWIYKVNSVSQNIGAGASEIKSGDEINWIYIEKYGEN
ncbi:DUF4430 domain-containing protein [Litchfieldia alkalitelluris]|uniref:DUF4430 domain-containing protein n=1 Tax=Litchfieldia alkalitelluris TaxID=304268 RepID=UPI00099616BC|nr:DUF4430 domain-containing protein [Litchfieldia alkalitelluris]